MFGLLIAIVIKHTKGTYQQDPRVRSFRVRANKTK